MELNFVITILNRDRGETMTSLYRDMNLPLVLTFLGRGTAEDEYLSLYDLKATEKAIVVAVADGEQTTRLVNAAKKKLCIDIPGNGIMMAVPVKSVGGGRTLAYLTDNAVPDKTVPKMEFNHELIVIILNQNYIDDVMNAARSAGAPGGTVLHAKGTGASYSKKFFGVSLAEEKEVVFIAVKSSKKTAVMKAVAEQAGPDTPAGAITFSLPVSAVAGIRDFEEDEAKG